MKKLCLVLSLTLAACATGPTGGSAGVKTGIDVLEENGFAALQGKRIGLITNPTGKNSSGRSTAEILAAAPGVTLVYLFSPEHGITGNSEIDNIQDGMVRLGGREIPVRSLYGGTVESMHPKQEDLKMLDALVFDIQDIGTRCYTYTATMGMALEETAKAGIEFIVLDRPNPINGLTMEGPVLDDLTLRQVTATAYFPVPIRHGMTVGEIARFYNSEVRNPKLKVIRMTGWSRQMWYDQTGLAWTPPSPNMPNLEAATLYSGVSLFESSNIAVGRGTPKESPLPFRWIGAPWMNGEAIAKFMNAAKLQGIEFSAQDYTPSKSVFKDQLCHGVRMIVTDRDKLRPVAVARHLMLALRQVHPQDFVWRWDEAKRMVGTDRLRDLYENDADPTKIERLFDQDIANFATVRQPFLLY